MRIQGRLGFIQKRREMVNEFPGEFGFIEATTLLVGGFKYFLFSPLFGEDSHFD